MDGSGHIIGIDLGTTNSVVAVLESGEPVVIPNAEGQPKLPSVIAFQPDGQVSVGEIARRQATTQPERTISSVKRLIGRLYQEIDEQELYPFELVEQTDGRVGIQVGDQTYQTEELSALVLGKLKEAAEAYLGEEVQRAIVTVPAYFDDLQRQATLEAARLAGLEVLRLLNEPTAAAMAYGLGRGEGQHVVAVYDFGGGTFDFSVLEIDQKTFEVLVSTGDSHLGGDDLDGALVDYLAEEFLRVHGLDLRQDIVTLRRLKDAAERAKCELSTAYETLVSLPFIAYQDGQPLHLETAVSRETFEELAEPIIRETLDCCAGALRQSKIRKADISKVILVGGSTRIPLVQDSVEDFFGLAPFKGLNPDEIVAVGAATQGAVMNGELDEVVLLDVTPHCLGIEVKGNRKSVVVAQNSTIPIKIDKTFTTTEDGQSFVNIHVLQGDSDKASECRSIGKFTLSGIESSAAGMPRIRVTFFINADGVVEIAATDLQSGAAKSLTISHAYLSVSERRSQQAASGRRRRRQRERGASTTGTRVKRRPGSSTATNKAESAAAARPRPAVSAPAAPDGTEHRDLADPSRALLSATFTEVHSDTGNRPEALTMVAPPLSATTVAPPAKAPGRNRQLAERADTATRCPGPAGLGVPTPAAFSATDSGPLAPGAMAPPVELAALPLQVAIPPVLEPLVQTLQRGCDEEALDPTYAAAREDWLCFCAENPDDAALQLLLARYYVFVKQAEEAREILLRLQGGHPKLAGDLLATYNQLAQSFPNYIAARKDRASLAIARGDYSTAMLDLEFVTRRDETDDTAMDQLAHLYGLMLARQTDPTVQFKLVKLHLRHQELDSAIGLLQQLVSLPDYHERASKVLGLCFWQKGMRYLAWQKFRGLTLDEEMKDSLYRLASDMEQHDELLHAKYVLECIHDHGGAYRDVADRLKKLRYRLELQLDDRYSGGPFRSPGGSDSGGEFARRFEVIQEINRGSMGIVYKARDLTLDEIVAIKVLNDFLCSDPQAIERFKQEARSARKLTHNNIVRIHDMFDLDNKKIISMEYIEGENLKTLLSRNTTFGEDLVLNYLLQICEGLAYAHRLHVIHRDIKPANIMITGQGLLKITDFGIAKLLTEHQTKAGTMVMGTPLYMAPEQIEGGRLDNRCDIYALGIMLYEMVSGKPPFFEGNIEYQHVHHAVPELPGTLSERLKRIIMKCVEKRPEDRFQAVEEILARIV